MRSPRFDAFAAEGVQLDTAVSSTPLCRPYRAALMSGRFGFNNGMVANISPHNFGVVDLDDWTPGQWRPPPGPTFGGTFAAAGYRCGYVGKWHLGPPNIDPGLMRHGFDDSWAASTVFTHDYYKWNYFTDARQKVSGGGFFRPRMEADLVLDFAAQDDPRPWMCMLSWGPPHEPLEPPEEFKKNYRGVAAPPDVPADLEKRAGKKTRLYYALVEALDVEFGRLLDELEARGLAENTIVVYTSDHGTMLGAQGLLGKEVPYSPSTQVPFLLRWPGGLPAGRRVAMPFGTPDILPTLAGLCGLPVPDGVDGGDFSGVLRGDAGAPTQDAVLLSSPDCRPVPFPGWRGVRTESVLYARQEGGPWLLFDTAADPWELDDLTMKRPELRDEMDARLAQLMDEHGDAWRPT